MQFYTQILNTIKTSKKIIQISRYNHMQFTSKNHVVCTCVALFLEYVVTKSILGLVLFLFFDIFMFEFKGRDSVVIMNILENLRSRETLGDLFILLKMFLENLSVFLSPGWNIVSKPFVSR